jgi:hypothetical protein
MTYLNYVLFIYLHKNIIFGNNLNFKIGEIFE